MCFFGALIYVTPNPLDPFASESNKESVVASEKVKQPGVQHLRPNIASESLRFIGFVVYGFVFRVLFCMAAVL